MNYPVLERVGGSSTRPSPSGFVPTNHFGVAALRAAGFRARDAIALARRRIAARVVLPGATLRLAWCGVVESERLFEALSLQFHACTSIYAIYYEPCARLKLPKSTNAATRSVQSLPLWHSLCLNTQSK